MTSYTPYRPNITDDEWYNFICGFIAGLKLRNKDNGFHETNQIVEDVPIGEEPSDMGIRILPNKYVSLSEISSVLRIPVYSHDVKTSYGAFDVTLQDGDRTIIEGIEASVSWKGSLTHRFYPGTDNHRWLISGRSLDDTNDYSKPIILFYVLVGLELYGEYKEGDEIGRIEGVNTYKSYDGTHYDGLSELYKYDNNGGLNMIRPSSYINNCWFILKDLNKDGNRVYNNVTTIGDKIRLKTWGLETKLWIPKSYDIFLDANRNYFELPVKILVDKEARDKGVKINHVVMDITFIREAYGYSYSRFCSSEYLSFSLLVNKNGWTWTSEISDIDNHGWIIRLVGEALSSSYDVYEDTDVLGIGLIGNPCPWHFGLYYYSAVLEGKDGSGNSYRNTTGGDGYQFINNINHSYESSYTPSLGEVAKTSVNTPYVTFSGNVYSIEEQDIELSVLGAYRDGQGNVKEVEFKSGPIHVVAGDNKVEASIALDSGVEVETTSGLNVKSQYAVTVKAGSEFNVDAGVGQYKASEIKDSDREDKIRVNDIFEFILEEGSGEYNEDIVEEAEIKDNYNVVYEQGSQIYNEDIVEEAEIRDNYDVVYEQDSNVYNEEAVENIEFRESYDVVYEQGPNIYNEGHTDDVEIRDKFNINYEQGPSVYSREIVDNININDEISLVYEQGQASEDDIEDITGGKGITSKVNISDVVEATKE